MSDAGTTTRQPPVEVYPGAPLRAVAIELGFLRRTLDAVSRFGAFQRSHAEFTRALLDDEKDGETVMLLDEASEKGVAISPNMLSVVTYPYKEGVLGFRRWADPILLDGLKVLELSRLSSVGYRYENVIERTEVVTLDRLLRIQLPKPEGAAIAESLYLSWEQTWPRGAVFIDVFTPASAHLHVHVDISARVRGPLGVEDVPAAIDEAHRIARLAFEDLITPELRQSLRAGGKVLS